MDTQNKQSKKKDNNDLLKVAAVIGLAYLFFKKGEKEIPNDGGTPIPDPLPMPLECPEGYYWGGSSCVEQIQHGLPIPDPMPPIPDPDEKPFECPPNSYWNGVDCIPMELPFECPPGTYLNEHGECVKKEQDAIDPECPDGYYMNESGHCIEIIQDHIAPRPEPDPMPPIPEPDPINDLVKEIIDPIIGTDPLNDLSLTVEPTCPDGFYWGGNSCVEMIQHQKPPEPMPPIPEPDPISDLVKEITDPIIGTDPLNDFSLTVEPICPDGFYWGGNSCVEMIQHQKPPEPMPPIPEPDPISDLVKEITDPIIGIDPLNDFSLTVEPICPDGFYWGGNSCVEMIQHQRPPEPLPPIPIPGGSDIKHDSDLNIKEGRELISSFDTSPINRLSGLRGTIFDKILFPQRGEPTLYYSEQDILNNERVKRYRIAESKVANRCQEFIGYDSEGLPVMTKKVFY